MPVTHAFIISNHLCSNRLYPTKSGQKVRHSDFCPSLGAFSAQWSVSLCARRVLSLCEGPGFNSAASQIFRGQLKYVLIPEHNCSKKIPSQICIYAVSVERKVSIISGRLGYENQHLQDQLWSTYDGKSSKQHNSEHKWKSMDVYIATLHVLTIASVVMAKLDLHVFICFISLNIFTLLILSPT